MRALRVDKFTIAALEATLNQYRNFEGALKELPTLRMLSENNSEVGDRAEALYNKLKDTESYEYQIEKDLAKVGGGAYPLIELDTFVLKIDPQIISAESFAYKLRQHSTPVFTRISEGSVILDLKTVQKSEIDLLAEILNEHFRRK